MHRKGLSRFSVANFLSHSTKYNVGEPFCVSGTFSYQNLLDIRSIAIVWKLFLSNVAEFLAGEPIGVSLISGFENF